MAKRGAGDQLTKDVAERDDRDSDGEDPGQRDAPLAPVEGRKIRGIPKRGKMSGMATPTPPPAAGSEAAPKPAFSGFSFGSTPAATSTPSSSAPFGFGAPAASTTPASTGFTFGAPAASTSAPKPSTGSTGFAFGSTPAAPKPEGSAASSFAFGSAPTSSTSAAPKPSSSIGSDFAFGSTPASSTPAATPSDATPAPSPFSGFSFGSKPTPAAAEAPKPAPSAASTEKSDAPKGFSFGSAPAPAASTGSFGFGNAPAAPPSAPSSNFAFGSSAANPTPAASASNAFSTPAQPASASTPSAPKPSQAEPPASGQVSYYTSIRGLNASILSFLTTTLENDAFVNLGEVLPGLAEQYNKYLEEAVRKAGWKPEASSGSNTKKAEEPKKSGFSMPAPPAGGFSLPSAPSGGFSFGGAAAPSTAAPPSSSAPKGFTPSVPVAASSSPFSFGTKPAETPKKTSAAVTKLVEDVLADKPAEEKKSENKDVTTTLPFSFGASTPVSSEKKPGSGLFAFAPSGPLHPSTPDSKSFSPSTNIENASSSTPPAKLGKFGPGGSAPSLPFGGAASTPGSAKSASTGFAFGTPGGGSGFSLGSGGPAPAGEKPSTGFSFSTPSSGTDKPSTPSFGFGSVAGTTEKKEDKPATSTFSFGGSAAPAPASSTFTFGSAPAAAAAPAKSTGFTFGSTPAAPTPFSGFGSAPAASSSTPAESAETTTESQEPQEASKNLAGTDGAGEEGEDTLQQIRTRLSKLEDGKWVTLGLGELRLKKAKEGGKRRLLLRSDGGGNVILNMAVTAALEMTPEGKGIRFIGVDLQGKPMPCRLAIKTPESAAAFAEAVNKEVAEVKKA